MRFIIPTAIALSLIKGRIGFNLSIFPKEQAARRGGVNINWILQKGMGNHADRSQLSIFRCHLLEFGKK